MTFVATANVVRYCQAFPIFIDIEPNYLTLDIEKVKSFFENECIHKTEGLYNKSSGRKVRGIIPVHLFGHPVDMSSLLGLASKYNLFVLEDATEAIGSKIMDQSAGTLGQIGVYSFNGNKMITTGGGGMVVTNDESLAKRIHHLTTQAKAQGYEYYHTEIGYNYRMTNIQAAIGLAQLEQLDNFVQKRREISFFYRNQLFQVEDIRTQRDALWAFNDCWLSWIILENDMSKRKNELIEYLNSENIQVRPLFVPLNTLPPYQDCVSYMIESAPFMYNSGLNLPSHTNLNSDDLNRVVDTIKSFLLG